jgi:hypothetical protein
MNIPFLSCLQWLSRISERIAACNAFSDASLPPNHILVNEYLPGQGIMVSQLGDVTCCII